MEKKELIVGKWYRGLGIQVSAAAKFVKSGKNKFFHTGEVIWEKESNSYDSRCGSYFSNVNWEQLELCTQEYLEKYLPKNHPDLLLNNEEKLLTIIL